MQPAPLTTFVTVFRARAEFLYWQQASLLQHVRGPWRLIVYDNAAIDGNRRASGHLAAICAELSVELRTVGRDEALIAKARAESNRPVFCRPWWGGRARYSNPSLSHGYALSWVWRDLARRSDLRGIVALIDSDLFLSRDLMPDEWLTEHELAFVPQHAPARTYLWPGLAFVWCDRVPDCGEMEWLPSWVDDVETDAGGSTARFLRQRPQLRLRYLRSRPLAGLDDLATPSEAILGPDDDLPLAFHFRAGSGWDGASRRERQRKCAAILGRVAWRDTVAGREIG